MTFIKKQLSLWRIVLIIGLTAIAIPIAVRVRATGIAAVNQRHENPAQPTANETEDNAKHSTGSKAAVGPGVGSQDDDYYERRREYWDKRVERRLDRLEDEDEDADAKDSKAAKDKDSKDAADDEDDEDDDVEKEVERRREYWRKRLDKDW
jgi:hypothetical protein